MYLYIRLQIRSKKIFIHWVSVQNSPGQNILPCPALCPVQVVLQGKWDRAKKKTLPCRAGQDARAIRLPCPDDDLWSVHNLFKGMRKCLAFDDRTMNYIDN